MDKLSFAVTILGIATFLVVFSTKLKKAKTFVSTIGFFLLITGGFASYANWLPQVKGDPPTEYAIDINSMPTDKIAQIGELIIFGNVGTMTGQGKGQCPLCHGFKAGDVSERAPNLYGIPKRAEERVNSELYRTQITSVKEACSGCGRAVTGEEYIAESHSCPSCFVAPGYGVKGSNDKESPMAVIHKAPIGLTIEEEIAVDTWLYYREGETPPSPNEIRKAYEKFIPLQDRIYSAADMNSQPSAAIKPGVIMGDEKPQEIVVKLGCIACHIIPTTIGRYGTIGPMLMEGTNAEKRIHSKEYLGKIKAGKAHAITAKEYVIESIVDPDAFIVPGFEQKATPGHSDMVRDFSTKMTYEAISKLADYLLTIDEETAKKDGLLSIGG